MVDRPHDRRPLARAALEAAGCTLKDHYFALGPADAVVIYEAPDAVTVASVSMTLGARGYIIIGRDHPTVYDGRGNGGDDEGRPGTEDLQAAHRRAVIADSR